ncbi:DUF2911 domain-containing protein [Xanthovirga aplysinae]|uniref:DUF2911 domain-containing protein n=1 Tax=Xanthovirga aplysinae TaxID=2529853 RepID=UPI0012BBB877|nr:DUF2911 domain-containing protein [Xanthovirga aplysinae]MTI29876.1 DUF2911 domain-containing protein [Xanthovirga aplysinae]
MRKDLLKSLLCVFCLFIGSSVVNAQIETPQPSPASTLIQKVGLADVTINYSRPGVKDRVIFGDLVPFDKVWRTGANASTKISFTEEVKLEGNTIPAGEYALYTIPSKSEWTIIIHKNTSHWGDSGYKAEEDLVRFKVKPQRSPTLIETFNFNITDITNTTAILQMAWENTVVNIKLETDIDSQIMASIEKNIINMDRNNANLYYQAANYYLTANKDMNQALEWINIALDARPDAFWYAHLKAKIQAQNKDYKNAIKSAEHSKQLAEKANNPAYVKMNEKLIAEYEKMM